MLYQWYCTIHQSNKPLNMVRLFMFYFANVHCLAEKKEFTVKIVK